MSDSQPLEPQRDHFEIPDDIAYLNCAFMAPNLRSVREAGQAAVAVKSRPWTVGPADFFEGGEVLRRRFGQLVGGDADGVAIIPSVSYGVGVAAANVALSRGEQVLVLAEQFPSHVYPWRAAADAAGAEIVTVPRPDPDAGWTQSILDRLGPTTAVVAVPHVHWADGSIVDLEDVGRAAREVGAALVVDATQSVGALPLDVSVVRPDFLVVAGYKWLLGPYSIGLLWAREDRRDGAPLEHNWITRAGSENFAGLVAYTDKFQDGARRYDVGERSNFVLTPMMNTALETILDWSVDRIQATAARHTRRIEDATRDLGLDPVPAESRGSHLMGVRLPGGVPDDLPERLADQQVHVSVRGDSLRISAHVWNTRDDLNRLFEVLESA